MPFRKCDLKKSGRQLHMPTDWFEVQRKVDEVVTKSGYVKQTVALHNVSSEEISKMQLDPDVVTAESLLSNNLSINPDSMKNCLNPTDSADVHTRVASVMDFFEKNKDEIVAGVSSEEKENSEKK